MTEEAILKDGHTISQSVEQRQIREAYEFRLEGAKATFQIFALKDGKKGELKESGTTRVGENFITGPMIEPYLQKKRNKLLAGEISRLNSEFLNW